MDACEGRFLGLLATHDADEDPGATEIPAGHDAGDAYHAFQARVFDLANQERANLFPQLFVDTFGASGHGAYTLWGLMMRRSRALPEGDGLAPAPLLTVDFQNVAFLEIVEALDDDTAFSAGVHLVHFVAEVT